MTRDGGTRAAVLPAAARTERGKEGVEGQSPAPVARRYLAQAWTRRTVGFAGGSSARASPKASLRGVAFTPQWPPWVPQPLSPAGTSRAAGPGGSRGPRPERECPGSARRWGESRMSGRLSAQGICRQGPFRSPQCGGRKRPREGVLGALRAPQGHGSDALLGGRRGKVDASLGKAFAAPPVSQVTSEATPQLPNFLSSSPLESGSGPRWSLAHRVLLLQCSVCSQLYRHQKCRHSAVPRAFHRPGRGLRVSIERS